MEVTSRPQRPVDLISGDVMESNPAPTLIGQLQPLLILGTNRLKQVVGTLNVSVDKLSRSIN